MPVKLINSFVAAQIFGVASERATLAPARALIRGHAAPRQRRGASLRPQSVHSNGAVSPTRPRRPTEGLPQGAFETCGRISCAVRDPSTALPTPFGRGLRRAGLRRTWRARHDNEFRKQRMAVVMNSFHSLIRCCILTGTAPRARASGTPQSSATGDSVAGGVVDVGHPLATWPGGAE